MMHFVFRWRTPCTAVMAEGLPSLNIFNNNNNNDDNNNNNKIIIIIIIIIIDYGTHK